MMVSRIIKLAVCIFLLSSCQHEPIVVGPIPSTNNKECHEDTVYFENSVLPILQTSCAISGCHDANTAQDGIVLESYLSIFNSQEDELVVPNQPGESKLYKFITETDPDKVMPPPPYNSLSAEAISDIRVWINQGVLNNACEVELCDTSSIGFAADVFPIINQNCLTCHASSVAQGGIVLDSYTNLKTQVDAGSIPAVLIDQAGYADMPPGPAKLSNCEIEQILIWINDGAPNN